VGIARFIRLKDDPAVAEAAVTVVDHMQRRGLGKLLVSALAQAARERGITRFRAEVLRTNEAMLALLRELDETARRSWTARSRPTTWHSPSRPPRNG